jgi:hypothetical protein
MKAGTVFHNTTDTWLREKLRDKGTDFVVAEEPKSGKKPVEVDSATAAAWQRNGWVKTGPADKPKATTTTAPSS